MGSIPKPVPKGTKLYTTLARCCRYQYRRPNGVQPVHSKEGDFAGWASLPQKIDGVYIYWII